MNILVSVAMQKTGPLCESQFDELYEALQQTLSYTDELLLQLLEQHISHVQPEVGLCFGSFSGNLFAAFRVAQWIRKNRPDIKVAMGGGFPNTELCVP